MINSNRIKMSALVVASALLIGGCSFPHDYEMGSVKTVKDFSTNQVFKDYQAMDWPNDLWWQRYNDDQLNTLIQEALKDSPALHIANARLKKAGGIAQQIGAIDDIHAGIGATASLTKVSYAYQDSNPPRNWNDYGTLTTDFSYDLDFWGKNRSLVAAGSSDYAASEAERATSRLMLSISVANAYAELARLYANQDTAQTACDIRNKTLELLSKRYDSGLETKGVVNQAIAAQASADAQLLAIKESIVLQKNLLALLLGKGPERGVSIQRPSVQLSMSFALPKDVGVGLLGHRPDITAARWRAESAASRIGAARAQYYPDIKLSGFVGYQAFGLDKLTSGGNDAGSIGPAIYLPIFNGDSLDGQLTSAEADFEAAVETYNSTLVQALHEVANVATSSEFLKAQIDKTSQAVSAAQNAHQIASNRYKGGLSTYLDVLMAENALLSSQRVLVNLQARSFSLDLSLVHALGGGYHSSAFQSQDR